MSSPPATVHSRRFVFIAMLALAGQAYAAVAIADHPKTVMAGADAGAEVAVNSSGLPSLELKKMIGSRSQLRNEAMPDAWRLLQGGGGKLIDPQGGIVIRGSGDAPLVNAELSPDGKRWLVDRGSGRYAICDLEGTCVHDVPGFEFPDASAITWRWKDASSLAGITEISRDERTPRYPDSDVRPSATLLFLYRLADGGGMLHALDVPQPPRGTVVRLDGVTTEGALILSSIAPEDYFAGTSGELLGIFGLE